jgi:aspartate 1-decarboxylase
MAYAWMDEKEAESYKPTVVMVDSKNKAVEVRRVEHAGEVG